MTPFPGELKRCSVYGRAYILTDEQKAWLCQWFPEVENRRLIKASGMTHSTLHRFARQYGLQKSKAGLRAIKRRQAAHIKRLCEENGYYDSLRGRKVHPNAIEGSRKMWQEIKAGKRLHPYKRMSKYRYKKMLKIKSVRRAELMRSDLIRMKWGLPRKTRIPTIVMQPYTKTQLCRRHYANKHGYILADDHSEGSGTRYVIFYDNKTIRRPIFERNCVRDGFRIERL